MHRKRPDLPAPAPRRSVMKAAAGAVPITVANAPTVRVLAALDESSYSGGTVNGDHPISRYQAYKGGRAFCTGLGRTKESYAEPASRQHLFGGITYATGVAK